MHFPVAAPVQLLWIRDQHTRWNASSWQSFGFIRSSVLNLHSVQKKKEKQEERGGGEGGGEQEQQQKVKKRKIPNEIERATARSPARPLSE